MSISLIFRTRTPPDLKWLLNERAALAGEVDKAAVRLAGVNEKTLQAEQRQTHLQGLSFEVHRYLTDKMASLAALDATIQIAYSEVNPSAAGVVHAWAGRYGRRGALKAFVIQSLEQVAPAPLTTTLLLCQVIRNFGLITEAGNERRRLRTTVTHYLRGLVRQGQVEAIHNGTQSGTGAWRLVGLPGIAALGLQCARPSCEQVPLNDRPAHTDPA